MFEFQLEKDMVGREDYSFSQFLFFKKDEKFSISRPHN